MAPLIRREVRSLSPEDEVLHAYSEAIRTMQERPDEDPTSWSYQAAIHGSEEANPRPLWNQCKHGTWYFVAWHRMYLYYFEQIVRAAVEDLGGPKDWAIPYWNYGLNGVNASIPDAFRNPKNDDGSKNYLYVEERAPGINGGAILPEPVTSATVALSRPDFIGVAEFGGGIAPPNEQFWSKTGRLEQSPHNVVHSLLGGLTGWMGNPDQAAKDPIFWLHHSNIDRLWALWNAHKHVDPSEAKWLQQSFEFFDAEGNQVAKSCAEVIDTIKDLDYTYDPSPAGVTAEPPTPTPLPPEIPSPTPEEPKVVGAAPEEVTLTGETAEVPVEVDERAKEEVEEASRNSDPRRLYLNIEDIEGEVDPGIVYGVYVNLPEGAGPEQREAHHVTNVSFFGIERAKNPREDEHSHSLRVSVDVGHILSAVGEEDKWDGKPIDVTFYPLYLSPGEGQDDAYLKKEQAEEHPPIRVGRVSLSVE